MPAQSRCPKRSRDLLHPSCRIETFERESEMRPDSLRGPEAPPSNRRLAPTSAVARTYRLGPLADSSFEAIRFAQQNGLDRPFLASHATDKISDASRKAFRRDRPHLASESRAEYSAGSFHGVKASVEPACAPVLAVGPDGHRFNLKFSLKRAAESAISSWPTADAQ
jgi:hypothetical protein